MKYSWSTDGDDGVMFQSKGLLLSLQTPIPEMFAAEMNSLSSLWSHCRGAVANRSGYIRPIEMSPSG